MLITPIATHGHLTPLKQPIANLPNNEQLIAEPMLGCSHCDVLIPLAEIAGHYTSSSIKYTLNILIEFGLQHANECIGQNGAEKLSEIEEHMAIAESISLSAQSKIIDQKNGLQILIAQYHLLIMKAYEFILVFIYSII